MKNLFKICLFFVLLLNANNVWADRGANIYEYPRDLPQKEIVGETGKKFKLNDFAGDFVIAVFWSRRCVPCLREMKILNKFSQKTKNDGIRVVLISPEKEWVGGFEEQKRFLKRFGGDDFEIYVDKNGDLASAFGIFSSPVSILISRGSKEIGRIRGSIRWDKSAVVEYFYQLKAEKG